MSLNNNTISVYNIIVFPVFKNLKNLRSTSQVLFNSLSYVHVQNIFNFKIFPFALGKFSMFMLVILVIIPTVIFAEFLMFLMTSLTLLKCSFVRDKLSQTLNKFKPIFSRNLQFFTFLYIDSTNSRIKSTMHSTMHIKKSK